MSSTILRTRTQAGDKPKQYVTVWMTEQQSGVVYTQLTHPQPLPDEPIIAEIWAIRELLIEREICGQDRTGENLTIELTHGATRKVMRRASCKKHLIHHLTWMLSRFGDAELCVPKKAPWQNEVLQAVEKEDSLFGQSLDLTVTPECNPGDTLEIDGIGHVRITQHAVERYQQRTGAKTQARAWRQICRLIRHGLTRAQIPEPVVRRKRMKYDSESELIMNAQNNWQMVFAQNSQASGSFALVTIYQRPGISAPVAA